MVECKIQMFTCIIYTMYGIFTYKITKLCDFRANVGKYYLDIPHIEHLSTLYNMAILYNINNVVTT